MGGYGYIFFFLFSFFFCYFELALTQDLDFSRIPCTENIFPKDYNSKNYSNDYGDMQRLNTFACIKVADNDEEKAFMRELIRLRSPLTFPLKNITLPYRFKRSLTYSSNPDEGKLTSVFNPRHLFGRDFHNGEDISLSVGTPVTAIMDGHIVQAKPQKDKYRNVTGFGNYIVIDHENGLSSVYGHLKSYNNFEHNYISRDPQRPGSFIYKRGTFVKAGEVIGYSGNTGQSTGSHLHIGLIVFRRGNISFRQTIVSCQKGSETFFPQKGDKLLNCTFKENLSFMPGMLDPKSIRKAYPENSRFHFHTVITESLAQKNFSFKDYLQGYSPEDQLALVKLNQIELDEPINQVNSILLGVKNLFEQESHNSSAPAEAADF